MSSGELSSQDDTRGSGWGQLFGPEHRTTVTVLAGGVLLYAMNVYLTTSLLPTAIADIGGRELYAWGITGFLITSVVSSLFVGRALAGLGARRAYLVGFALFGVGALVAALAPSMAVFIAGRAVQGLGGGLLAGLGFAVIRQTLPAQLWSRSLGVTSAMWGVGNLVGPSVGGLFAQIGQWRWAMVLLVVLSVVLGLAAARSMPRGSDTERDEHVPAIALSAVIGIAAAVSVASVTHGVAAYLLLALAVLFGAGFVLRDRRAPVRVLPAITYRRGNALKWVYVSMALLAIGSTAETFIPQFGQNLGHLGPLLAGLLGAALSWGWSIAGITSSNVDDERIRARLRALGPVLLAVGLAAYAALQVRDAGWWSIGGWTISLMIAGAGIGMAFQHGATAAMSSTSDPAEATRAAAGVNTVQLIANSIGSAVAGLLVNLGSPSELRSAHLLLWSYAGVALVGIWTARRANHRLADADAQHQLVARERALR